MRQTVLIGEPGCSIGIDRAEFHARFSDTCIAKMTRFASLLNRNLNVEKQRPAIGVPEAVFGMHENAERRWLQPLRPHRPLLERQPRPVRWRHGARAEVSRHLPDHFARPGVERIFLVSRLLFPPAQEMRPGVRPRLPHQQNRPGRRARRAGRRAFVATENEIAARDETMPGQRGGNAFKETGRQASPLPARIGKCRPPDFLVDDVGHFSPA